MGRDERKSGGSLRLFLAIYPPAPVVESLLGSMRKLRDLPPYREVRSDQIHLTLHFMGQVHPRKMDQVIETVYRAKKGIYQFDLKLMRMVGYPRLNRAADSTQDSASLSSRRHHDRRRNASAPRLIAAETDRPDYLVELRNRLVRRLAREVRENPNDRYVPHVTLCRFRPIRAAEYSFGEVDWAVCGASLADSDDLTFTVKRFSLMKSTLSPREVVHEEVATWPLSPCK